MWKGQNTDHLGVGPCWIHRGNTAAARAKGLVELTRREADRERVRLGGELGIDPAEALLKVLRLAHMDVFVWGLLVEELEAPVGTVGTGESVPVGTDGRLWGPLYHLSGVRTGEAVVHVAVREHQGAQKRLKEAAEACVRAKLHESLMKRAQVEADMLLVFGRHLVSQLGHSASDPNVRKAFREALQAASADPSVVEGKALPVGKKKA